MATPSAFVRILKRLGFKKGSGGPEYDNWSVKPKGMTSEVWVQVYDDDEWFIQWEEVRDEGIGTSSMVKSLKGFLAQGKRTNEGVGGRLAESGLYRTPKDVLRVLMKLKFQPDHSAEARPGPTVWEFPRAVRQKRKTDISVEVDELTGTWTVYSGEIYQSGKGGAQLAKALKKGLAQEPRTDEAELEELTGTGGVAGFGTPYAFATKEPVSSKKRKIHEVKVISLKALIVETVTPREFESFLKKHRFSLHSPALGVVPHTRSPHSSDTVDIWKQNSTEVYADISKGGNWRVQYGPGKGKHVTSGSGLPNLKSALSKYVRIQGPGESVNEAGDPYYPWRNDETQTPKQKIGKAISEINKQLAEVEKVVRRTQRLKKESDTANGSLWKRTNNSLMKIESRMHRISQTIRNMRG